MNAPTSSRMARSKRPIRKVTGKHKWFKLVGMIGLFSLIASIVSIAVLERTKGSLIKSKVKGTTRIAFGSDTSLDYRSQPIWIQGVIPSSPDAWIWLGDMAYLDKTKVNCDDLPWHSQCNCSSTWLHQPNHSCMAGNLEFASSRMEVQLSNPDYAQFHNSASICFFMMAVPSLMFLAFMCPGHRAKGLHPPTGSDPSICSRQILGIYDDHDYGWEHGNRRLPQKDEMKQSFLDAIGEPSGSPRRNPGRGIEWKHTLNGKKPGQFIDIFLLDERYYRDTLPCYTRKSFCEKVALADIQHPKHAWCLDFLQGGKLHGGSCCKKDENVYYGWCLQSNNEAHALWDSLCNPKSGVYGHHVSALEHHKIPDMVDFDQKSPFCEVLGEQQRDWFENEILGSKAPLKLVVSSSVVLGNPLKNTCEDLGSIVDGVECPCSGDDWECYKPAQLQFLNVLSRSSGCVVLLAGGLEYSDIRVLREGAYDKLKYYGDLDISYPLFQGTASGLTTSAKRNFSCDALRQDPLRLRDHAECDFVKAPSFGLIEVEWESDPLIKIQIRDGTTGSVKLESRLALSKCAHMPPARKVKG